MEWPKQKIALNWSGGASHVPTTRCAKSPLASCWHAGYCPRCLCMVHALLLVVVVYLTIAMVVVVTAVAVLWWWWYRIYTVTI